MISTTSTISVGTKLKPRFWWVWLRQDKICFFFHSWERRRRDYLCGMVCLFSYKYNFKESVILLRLKIWAKQVGPSWWVISGTMLTVVVVLLQPLFVSFLSLILVAVWLRYNSNPTCIVFLFCCKRFASNFVSKKNITLNLSKIWIPQTHKLQQWLEKRRKIIVYLMISG